MKTILLSIASAVLVNSSFAQSIPTDSLYLGQIPPGATPNIFNLKVATGFFAAERVATSKDGKSIFYTEINGYDATSISRIKYYSYDSSKWNGPSILNEGYSGTAFSVTDDTVFNEKDFKPYYSFKNGSGWSTPKMFLPKLNSAHYLCVTNKGNYYAMSRPKTITGKAEWCKLVINGTDTSAVSLGLPTNSYRNPYWDFYDFVVSCDESYMIGSDGKMWISYHKEDDTWTNPKYLDAKINFGMAMWGNSVSPDNKYLFYTTGTKSDYSDTHVYWVRIDGIIDSLKKTNFTPYLKNTINNQTDSLGHSFSLVISDSTFFDDDGNNTLSYSAKLSNNKPLPTWLPFDPETKTFTGTLDSIGTLTIKVTAIDTAKASVSTTFKLKVVGNPTSIQQNLNQNIHVYPNPTKNKINISFGSISYKNAIVELTDISGKLISSDIYHNLFSTTIDLTDRPKGIYILTLSIDGEVINKKFCIE